MALEGGRFPELAIGAVQVVQDAERAEAIVEALVMEVVELGRREQREMVAAVVVASVEQHHRHSQPNHEHVRAGQYESLEMSHFNS